MSLAGTKLIPLRLWSQSFAITVEDVGDTRTINTPCSEMEFKLKRCKTRGNYWAPERQLDYIVKKLDLAPEVFDNCPNCRG